MTCSAFVHHVSPVRRDGLAKSLPAAYIGSVRPFREATTFMLSDIYNDRILELAANLPSIGRLPSPDATATAHSKLCGSTVTVDVALGADGMVADFAHDVKACALGQASSSIMARNVLGSSPDELRALRDTMRAMLKAGGTPPTGRWADCARRQQASWSLPASSRPNPWRTWRTVSKRPGPITIPKYSRALRYSLRRMGVFAPAGMCQLRCRSGFIPRIKNWNCMGLILDDGRGQKI